MDDLNNVYKYHEPKAGQPGKYTAIREKAKEYAELIKESCPLSVEAETALTRLKEATMWANASIAQNS